ncbi:hypothetical protein [Deinococcus aerophilus]|nr:hypothetical protein [Deinococcus aerophilus]
MNEKDAVISHRKPMTTNGKIIQDAPPAMKTNEASSAVSSARQRRCQ